GIDTTILEARDLPGGRAYVWHREGYTFDAGPTVITDPACLQELWALSGADMAADVELVPVTPFYRLNWPDGTNFDYTNDDPALPVLLRRRLRRRLREARRGAVPRFRVDAEGGASTGALSGMAVGLFDGLELRAQREAAPGAVVPHAAGRRQSDDHERDLRAD